MTDSNIGFDNTKLDEQLKFLDEYIKQNEKKKERDAAKIEAIDKTESQMLAEQDDPRAADKWGFAATATEVGSAFKGGFQDTASSIATFPERTIDAFSGEMQRERQEKGEYRPEFHPFTDYENPIITKTWWGKLLRGTVHFGSMAAAIIPSFKVTAARLGVGAAWAGANSLVRAAAIGATSDLISKESDGHNALGALRDQYGFIDTPLSTKDTDHPIWMKFKNIVEGMGIGTIFDSSTLLLGKGVSKVQKKVIRRNKSINEQTVEKGLEEFREAKWRASKNSTTAQPHQGAHLSKDEPDEVLDGLKRTRNEWGAEDGDAGNVTTALERERIANGDLDVAEEVVENTLKQLWSSEKFQRTVEALKGGRLSLKEVYGDAVSLHQKITNGRNAAEMTTEQYLEELYKLKPDVLGGEEILGGMEVIASDLVISSLLQNLRSLGIAGRELAQYAKLDDIDGPAKQTLDTLTTLWTLTKKSRAARGRGLKVLDSQNPETALGKRALQDVVKKDVAESKEAILTLLQVAKEDADPDLMNAVFEAFSMMKDINSLEDFDHWARTMLKGGRLDPNRPARVGIAVRELGGVMIHSILSGPKTPIRALMGTGIAGTFRPISTAVGATMRYPFTGDSATIRSSLASLNAMRETIPEAFELFKTKLQGYWSGELSTIKSRYTEYSRDDNNWEILRRWAEDSGRATDGDKAAFRIANMARNLNDNKFLTYSTRLMAATDDTWRYILGRAKMREKAMLDALELQGKGYLPRIDPQVIKKYEDDFYAQIFDGNGHIKDEATQFAAKEITLTQELEGLPKGLNDLFNAQPMLKPFFLFARTGVNGLNLTAKHTPGFNFLVKEFNDIAFAKPTDLSEVSRYGITNPQELINAKALQTGRLGIGSAITFMAIQDWLGGNLTGNGPVDRAQRQMWLDAGWKPRSRRFGDVWVNYEWVEPFNMIASTVSDIGDYSMLMGEEWTKNELQKVSLVIAQAITSKSYLAGLTSAVDFFAGRPGQQGRVLGGLLNNTVPMAGLRNEIGKIFTPHMKELGSGIFQAIRNRNLTSEYLPGQDLPIKYDFTNGKPLRSYDFLTRVHNAIFPWQFNLNHSPGKEFLFNSGYDMRMSVYYAPDGTDLSEEPELRSRFQQAVGNYNIEHELNKLARDPRARESLRQMLRDIQNGDRGKFEATDYYHNKRIKIIMDLARRKGWNDVLHSFPEAAQLKESQRLAKVDRIRKQRQTSEYEPLLNMYK